MRRVIIVLVAAVMASCGSSSTNNDNENSQAQQTMSKAMSAFNGFGKNDNHVDYNYTVNDLAGSWTCNTESGDLTEYFGIDIQPVSDNEIMLVNFHNMGKNIKATLNGNKLEFGGQLNRDYELVDCNGTIDKTFSQISLTYSIKDDDGETDSFELTLHKGMPLTTPAPAL